MAYYTDPTLPKVADPLTARFVVFHCHTPEWFNSFADAAKYADELGIPRTKIYPTNTQRRPAGL